MNEGCYELLVKICNFLNFETFSNSQNSSMYDKITHFLLIDNIHSIIKKKDN